MGMRGDIPFGKDPASRMMPWIIGFMVFIAGLALSGALALSAFSDRWERGLAGSLTVQVPAEADTAQDDAQGDASDRNTRSELLDRVRDALRNTPGVTDAEIIAPGRIGALLEPWLGGAVDPRDLPLPDLIAATVESDATPDLAELQRRLDAIRPGIRVDDHGLWRQRLVDFMGALQLVAFSVVAVVMIAAAAMVVFATRSGLLAHRETISLLHLIGAQDGYIAGQFQGQAMRAGLKGGIFGIAVAIAMVLLLGHGAAATGTGASPSDPGEIGMGILRTGDWALVVAVPVVTTLLAMIAARRTVLRALAKMV